MAYEIPCHYDGKPWWRTPGGMPLMYETATGEYLCPACVGDNLSLCRDKNSPDFLVVGDFPALPRTECWLCREREYHGLQTNEGASQ